MGKAYADCQQADRKLAQVHQKMVQSYSQKYFNNQNEINLFNKTISQILSQPENIVCNYPLSEQSGLKVLYTPDRQAIAFQWNWRGKIKSVDNIIAAKNAKNTVYFTNTRENENPHEIRALIPADLNGKRHYWVEYGLRSPRADKQTDFALRLWAVPQKMRHKPLKNLGMLRDMSKNKAFFLQDALLLPTYNAFSQKNELSSMLGHFYLDKNIHQPFQYDDKSKMFRLPETQREQIAEYRYMDKLTGKTKNYRFNGKQFVLDKTE